MNKKNRKSPRWLRLSELTNAIDYIEKANVFIPSALSKPIDWKWVVISLDTAFYLFIICCLGTVSFFNVMEPKNKKYSKMTKYDAYETNGLRLIGYKDAIKRFQLIYKVQFDSDQIRTIGKYHDLFRNTFIHYKPSRWSIEVSGFPGLTITMLELITIVLSKTPLYHISQTKQNRLHLMIRKDIRLLKKELKIKYYKTNPIIPLAARPGAA